ncbi:MAG: response regulator [Patescibacteria group bacterium]|nr:response regulator [Patescibacteria group bacterium]MCX7589682.1 response regulator [Patescibacteria group bacterium]MDW8279798.1 response regulator [bacterium]
MNDNQPKIFIIEDDKFLSLVLKGRLEREGIKVFQAFDGKEALDLLKQEIPDLILLDLIMPNMSGFEFLENLRQDPQYASIPVVVISNLGQETDVQKAKTFGVIEYYVKVRTSIEDLISRIKEIIQK